MIEKRPWGYYEVLYEDSCCKVKKIVLKKNGRLSYQSHEFRDENWTIIKGEGVLTLDNVEEYAMPGDSFTILKGQKHRIEHCKDEELVFIEVQTGSYLGEDDIRRFSDDYGRAKDSKA